MFLAEVASGGSGRAGSEAHDGRPSRPPLRRGLPVQLPTEFPEEPRCRSLNLQVPPHHAAGDTSVLRLTLHFLCNGFHGGTSD
jgi:hypothetical protein